MALDGAVRPRQAARPARRTRSVTRLRLLTVLALLLAAVNLRPAITSLGPVLAEVRAALGMNATLAGLLTAMPTACFALVGFVAPWMARRAGTATVITAGITVTAIGLALRPFTATTVLFVTMSALALAGIALVNVLLPAVVKQRFPDRVGPMTGLYSMALNLGAATAAAVTVPLTRSFGGDWRLGLAAWAALATVAVPPWLSLARDRSRSAADPRGTAGARPSTDVRIARSPIAWALAVYFGLQATVAYVSMGWLPQVFRDAGVPAETAGLLFAVTAMLGVPLSFALPAVAARLANQSGIAAVTGMFGLAGYAGLYLVPAAAPWLWAVLLGVANCSFPLALMMIGMRGRGSAVVARLSAFTQSVGYLLSIPGPLLVGMLYEHTGGWRAPLAFLALLMLPQLVAGMLAGRDRQLG